MRRTAIPILAASVLLGGLPGCGHSSRPPVEDLGVMTRNVYYGADLAPAMAAVLAEDPDAIVAGVTLVWSQVLATDFSVRAQGLADEIEAARPHLVALQEAARWFIQSPSDAFTPTPTPATDVALDLVEVLLAELASRGLPYEVVASSDGFDAEFPMLDASFDLADLRITDRDVILARADAEGFSVLGAGGGNFDTNLVLPNGFPILMSRLWADVRLRGVDVRLVSTHLDADVPDLRTAQAAEILAGPADTSTPVILVGDMNFDADAPVLEDAHLLWLGAGFSDAWAAIHGSLPGPTALFDAGVADPSAVLTQRLDLVLWRGAVVPLTAEIRGEDASDRVGGLWPSDHAGVSATFRLW